MLLFCTWHMVGSPVDMAAAAEVTVSLQASSNGNILAPTHVHGTAS